MQKHGSRLDYLENLYFSECFALGRTLDVVMCRMLLQAHAVDELVEEILNDNALSEYPTYLEALEDAIYFDLFPPYSLDGECFIDIPLLGVVTHLRRYLNIKRKSIDAYSTLLYPWFILVTHLRTFLNIKRISLDVYSTKVYPWLDQGMPSRWHDVSDSTTTLLSISLNPDIFGLMVKYLKGLYLPLALTCRQFSTILTNDNVEQFMGGPTSFLIWTLLRF